MRFLTERKRRKLAAEMKARRHAEDDLLSPALRQRFDELVSKLIDAPADDQLPQTIKAVAAEYAAFPFPEKRGNMYALLDLLAVVGAVAFGLRGLFFQPFQIPTSSMQPTLYGIHYMVREGNSNSWLNKVPAPFKNILFGVTRAFAVTKNGGALTDLLPAGGKVFDHTMIQVDNEKFVLPGNESQVVSYTGLVSNPAAPGTVLADGYVSLGDHLFVERFSLYLSPPARGDIMVFTTEGLEVNGKSLASASGHYYIKRVAALPGDTIKIVKNQLYVKVPGSADFKRIQDIAPAFEKVYSGRGGYHGHLTEMGGMPFAAEGVEYTVPEDRYIMLGDNSKFSLDSRFFGAVHRNNLVGRAWVTFYPLSRRTGLIDRNKPLDVTTGESVGTSFPVMYKQ